jgi:hypothetical protein
VPPPPSLATLPRRPSGFPAAPGAAGRSCQSFTASCRDRAASATGASSAPGTASGADESTIVPNTDSVPSWLSASSTSRACWGKSMCDAVFTSQKPPPIAAPAARGCGVTELTCVWPFTHSTTFG